jgi:hypothetical protein
VWSKRFETPLILHPPEAAELAAAALAVWVPAAVLLVMAPIPLPASLVLAAWLLAASAWEIRTWSLQPARAVWRPRQGWSLEWADGSRRSARLCSDSRVYPGWLALEWSVTRGRRVRLLLLPGRGRATSLRRLRVLLRCGRAAG